MTLPDSDTIADYPSGALSNAAIVLHVETRGDHDIVLLDSTSCHPVDVSWPDQGADRAALRIDGADRPLVDCIVAATDGSTLLLGADIPVRKGTEGWIFVVAHVVAAGSGLAEGDTVEVIVDGAYRRALSTGHSACHVASLALNRALAHRWGKETRPDGLGQPDFDGSAIESSTIHEHGSIDVYRLNKSLRRKGFDMDGLAESLPMVAESVNATLAEWIASSAMVRVDRDGPRLTDRRHWVCELPEASVSIPCGGTHVSSLDELGTVRVELTIGDDEGTSILTMETSAE
ncbi:metal-dependent hydrolase [Luethyella okanaganae]|uniref:Metal-dependent hydrolase n=1 Tax=Luethyella okanaganae TaxID=69372 RepID=A0ABW1VGG9_9MICO